MRSSEGPVGTGKHKNSQRFIQRGPALGALLARETQIRISRSPMPYGSHMPDADGSFAVVLEPATQQFIDVLVAAGGPSIYTLSPEEARAVFVAAQADPVGKPAALI